MREGPKFRGLLIGGGVRRGHTCYRGFVESLPNFKFD